ncbi:hypothetical protein NGA_2035400, partial [Nannochloropsis gaditana CCMP526]|uniref:uncharacterized protein n=1 Tax=Nannochloropsis gaditana (strain CCMP526) TaxID=1093141 RepID=UPI00029F7435
PGAWDGAVPHLHGVGRQGDVDRVLPPQEEAQRLHHRGGGGGVPCDVVGVDGRGPERRPTCVRGQGILVPVPKADGRHGTPEAVVVFGVPRGDLGVRESDGPTLEKGTGLDQVHGRSDLPNHVVEAEHLVPGPEDGDCGLFLGTSAPRHAAVALHLQVG